jgi:hypothetical protein
MTGIKKWLVVSGWWSEKAKTKEGSPRIYADERGSATTASSGGEGVRDLDSRRHLWGPSAKGGPQDDSPEKFVRHFRAKDENPRPSQKMAKTGHPATSRVKKVSGGTDGSQHLWDASAKRGPQDDRSERPTHAK